MSNRETVSKPVQPRRTDTEKCGLPRSSSEARLPLCFNGMEPATFIKLAFGLGSDLKGAGRYDQSDPVQQELRRIRDWITMAEHDSLDARRGYCS